MAKKKDKEHYNKVIAKYERMKKTYDKMIEREQKQLKKVIKDMEKPKWANDKTFTFIKNHIPIHIKEMEESKVRIDGFIENIYKIQALDL